MAVDLIAQQPSAPPTGHCDDCGQGRGTRLFEATDRRFGLPGEFAVVRCDSCGLVRTDPQPADPGAYYPTDAYYSYQPPAPPKGLTRARVRSAYGLDRGAPLRERVLARAGRSRLLPGLPPGPPGRILDVGCGSGEFLLALREAGWTTEGVEMDGAAVAAAQAAGLDAVRQGDITELDLPAGGFDAVRYWHVLEHVRSPREQLLAARRALRTGGTLTIGVPNAGSALFKTARTAWYYLDVPRHLWHFDRRSLSRLVGDCGFEVRSARLISTPTAMLGTLGYLTGKGEELVGKRGPFYAGLPLSAALDRVGLGDAIELTAVAVDAPRTQLVA